MIDPMSGNPVPPGAMPNEVRDDVPISASEGEYVLSADVVRFIGLDKIQKMEEQAKQRMADMANGGRIGGEPPGPPMDQPMEAPMMRNGGMVKKGYAAGGLVPGSIGLTEGDLRGALSPYPYNARLGARPPQQSAFSQGQVPVPASGSGTGAVGNGFMQYRGPSGQIMMVPTQDGRPVIQIPAGFQPIAGSAQERGAAERDESGFNQPMSFDQLMSSAERVGQPRSGVESALVQGLSMLGPGGALAARALEHFERSNAQRTQRELERALSTGVAPDGQPLTPEQRQSLEGQLSRLGGTIPAGPAPSGAAPVSPAQAPAGPITETPLDSRSFNPLTGEFTEGPQNSRGRSPFDAVKNNVNALIEGHTMGGVPRPNDQIMGHPFFAVENAVRSLSASHINDMSSSRSDPYAGMPDDIALNNLDKPGSSADRPTSGYTANRDSGKGVAASRDAPSGASRGVGNSAGPATAAPSRDTSNSVGPSKDTGNSSSRGSGNASPEKDGGSKFYRGGLVAKGDDFPVMSMAKGGLIKKR